ncbi:PAS domain S-box protein [Candidatus Amarobacter glycogenicus]|uniref:PAS domain-containing hybrid sensor histidine kinase/response regulator n=1 Tax=Candidatus Amarobacter glycogenicus TaxID=3140699 RepID=UPI003136EA8E|nr:PAS domain S-box protein [Dehalococcoidia bacterium]
MNIAIVAAEMETAERLSRALRASGFDARAFPPGLPIPEGMDALALDGFPVGSWPAILAALIPAEAPRPYCFAGISDLSAQAVDAGLRAGMDEFYVAGTEASIVFRVTLWARKGVYAAVAEAAAQRIEQANDVIYTIDFEGRFTSANAAAERLTGVPREQLMGKHLSELLPPEYAELAMAHANSKLAGESESSVYELQILHADGRPRWVEVSSRLLVENGRPSGVQGIARDVTARREMELGLTFRAEVLENLQAAAFAVDSDGVVLFWNRGAAAMFGIPAAEAVGRPVIERILPEERVARALGSLRADGGLGPRSRETTLMRADGTAFPAHIAASTLRDSDGVAIGAVGVCIDLTERIASEEALKASEERYRAASESSLEAFAILHSVRDERGAIVDFRFVDMNPAAERLLTIPRDVAIGGLIRELLPAISSRGFFDAYVDVVDSGEPLDAEAHLTSPRISAEWVHQTVVRLGDGIAVTLRNITERKRQQLELDQARAQLKAVFESTSEGILVIAPDLTLIVANHASNEGAIAAYGSAPLPGDYLRPWVAEHDWDAFQENCRRALAGERITSTSALPRGSGGQAWYEFTFNPVRDETDQIYAVSVIARDITEARRLGRELAEREAALQAVFSSMNEALMLVDDELRFIMGNPIALERVKKFGGSPPETGNAMEEYIPPERWASFREYITRAFLGEHPAIELQLTDPKTGAVSWWEHVYHPVRDASGEVVAAAATSRDISARKAAEEALRRATAHHRAVIENTTDGMFALDIEESPNGQTFRVAMVNSAFERLTGLSAERVTGLPVEEALPRWIVPAALEHYHRVITAGAPITYEEVISYGDRPHVQTTMSPVFDAEGRCVQIIGSSRDITASVRLAEEERASRERAERLAIIVQSANDAIQAIDLQGIITSWSPGATRVYGYTAEEVIGQPASMLYTDDEQVVNETLRRFEGLLTGEGYVGVPTRRKHKDGHTIDIIVSAFPLRDSAGNIIGAGSTATDVTEQRRTEAAFREKAADLDAVFSTSRDQILLLDTEGTIINANPAARLAWRLGRPDRVLDGRFRDFVPAEDAPDFDVKFAAALRGEPTAFERHTRLGGNSAWFDVSYGPVRLEDGSIRGVVITSRDITDRKRSSEALLQAQKLESLAVLAGGIAHDFNNLLVGILGNAGLALAGLPANSPARPTIEAIELAGQRAAELARQMLAYSGKGNFLIQDIDLSAVVQEMTHLLRVSIGKAIDLRLHLASDLPLVQGDATQLRQVVMNLVVNASDAIGSAHGVISITTSTVEATRALLAGTYLSPDLPAGRYVSLEVEDTGSGMEAETLARIFDPFFTTKFTGRGLGLAATLGIMRGHRGAIKVETETGKGTAFRLLFPASAESASPHPPVLQPAPWRGSGTVLVVDDEPTVRNVTARALKSFGFDVLEAADGIEGVEMFRQHPEIACVLLDMTMPRMNGEAAFGEIRKERPEARVILMSGYAEQDATDRFGGSGLSGFIQKPYDLATLRSVVRNAIGADPAP